MSLSPHRRLAASGAAAVMLIAGLGTAFAAPASAGVATPCSGSYTQSSACTVAPGVTVTWTLKGGNGGPGGSGGNGGMGGDAQNSTLDGTFLGGTGGQGGQGGSGGSGAKVTGTYTNDTAETVVLVFSIGIDGNAGTGGDAGVDGLPGVGGETPGEDGLPGSGGSDGDPGQPSGLSVMDGDSIVFVLGGMGGMGGQGGQGGQGATPVADGFFGDPGQPGLDGLNGNDAQQLAAGQSLVSTTVAEAASIEFGTPEPPAPPTPTPDAASTPAVASYTITYDANGGTCATASQTLESGSAPTAPTCTRTNADFAGWSPAVPATLTGDMTVTAQWTMHPKPGTLTVLETDRRANSVKFTYAYDDTAPADTFIVTDKAGALVCSSGRDSNTCTGTGDAVSGTAFQVFARNAVGDGPVASVTVPMLERGISIVCERKTVNGKPGVGCEGETTGIAAGQTVNVYVRFPGETSYMQGSAKPAVDSTGSFSWSRKTGKKVYVYFTTADESVKSNRVVIPAN